jgi:hypothetical protein
MQHKAPIKRAACMVRMRRMKEEQIVRVERGVSALSLGAREWGRGNTRMMAATPSSV